MRVVLVSWKVRADAVEQFKKDFSPLPKETPGLVREDLYRLEDGSDDDVARFVRIGRWESEEAFYKALEHLGTKPYATPPPKPYEVDPPPRREWLVLDRDDIPRPGAEVEDSQ
jgi:hypothetical protein